jgi:chorismate-pyruvate lyase
MPVSSLSPHPSIEPICTELTALLLCGGTATAALSAWCGGAEISARLIASEQVAISDARRETLTVDPLAALAYRYVALTCGGLTLSHAHNWYVPGRLSAAMNEALGATNTPFGAVIAPLAPRRETITINRLWQSADALGPLLGLEAIVYSGDGLPLAFVVETYERALLDFRT